MAPWRYGRTVHLQRSWAHVRTRRRAPAFSCRDSGRSQPTSARVEARLARRHLSMPPCGRRHAGRRSFESCNSLPSQLDRSTVHAIAGVYVGNIRPASGASSKDEHHRTTFLCAIAAKKRKELGRGGAATTQSRNHRRKPGPRLEVHTPHMPAMSPCCGSAHCSNPRRSQFQRSMPAGLRASSCLCLPVATGRRRGLGHQRRMPEPRATS
jgi:hypothetical protein